MMTATRRILIPSAHALTTVMVVPTSNVLGFRWSRRPPCGYATRAQADTLYIDLVDYFVDTMVEHA